MKIISIFVLVLLSSCAASVSSDVVFEEFSYGEHKNQKLTFILAKRIKFWFGFMAEVGFLVVKEKRDGFEDLVGILR